MSGLTSAATRFMRSLLSLSHMHGDHGAVRLRSSRRESALTSFGLSGLTSAATRFMESTEESDPVELREGPAGLRSTRRSPPATFSLPQGAAPGCVVRFAGRSSRGHEDVGVVYSRNR